MLAKWYRMEEEHKEAVYKARFQESVWLHRPEVYDKMYPNASGGEEVSQEESLGADDLSELNSLFDSIGKTKTFTANSLGDDEGWI